MCQNWSLSLCMQYMGDKWDIDVFIVSPVLVAVARDEDEDE